MLKIEILSRGHDRDGFDCGSDPLNTYLRHTARQHIERGISRTFVLVEESAAEPKPIAGFFTLNICQLRSDQLPAEMARRLPREIAGVKLGRADWPLRRPGSDRAWADYSSWRRCGSSLKCSIPPVVSGCSSTPRTLKRRRITSGSASFLCQTVRGSSSFPRRQSAKPWPTTARPLSGALSGALPAEVPSGHQKELGNDAEAMVYADEHGFFDLPLIEELIDRNTAPAPLARAREVFLGFNRLAAQELLATCRNADSLTELALAQFMEKLAPGRYHLAPKSLVSGCRSRADLEERIRRFRRVVPAS